MNTGRRSRQVIAALTLASTMCLTTYSPTSYVDEEDVYEALDIHNDDVISGDWDDISCPHRLEFRVRAKIVCRVTSEGADQGEDPRNWGKVTIEVVTPQHGFAPQLRVCGCTDYWPGLKAVF